MNDDALTYDRINDYDAVRIGLASPDDIRFWSSGEVREAKTIDSRRGGPVKDGLFCERIFGPLKDWECACGKYSGMERQGLSCDDCGVTVMQAKSRRRRMGHIELAAPVVHVWFVKASRGPLAALLDLDVLSLTKIIYFQEFVVIDSGDTPLTVQQLLTDEECRSARLQFGNAFEVETGAEAIRKLLQRLDLIESSKQLRAELAALGSQREPLPRKHLDLIKRLKIIEACRDSGQEGRANRPEWMVLECIPVIPPGLRPVRRLKNGNLRTDDLNVLYGRVIKRNNRLKKLFLLKAPDVIIRNEKRMLQQAVDALFDNFHCRRPVLSKKKRPLRSLTDQIRGRQSGLRPIVRAKRVDFSARSVMVPGPALKLHQCGLPRKVALELFGPFVVRRLMEMGEEDSPASGRDRLKQADAVVWEALQDAMQGHPVLLCRPRVLQQFGIQAFEPVLTEGNAIRVHPLVCRALDTEFHGEQIAVHLPLSIEAQAEATVLMMSTNNVFNPTNGHPIVKPLLDIVMGCYYLTVDPWAPFAGFASWDDDKLKINRHAVQQDNFKGAGMIFSSPAEVLLAHALKKVGVHARIKVRLPLDKNVVEKEIVKGETISENRHGRGFVVNTTVGRVLFNDILDARMPFYDLTLTRKQLELIIVDCQRLLGRRAMIELLDRMKEIGFRAATGSGLSLALSDLKTTPNREKVLREAHEKIEKFHRQHERGIITNHERYNKALDVWTDTRDGITNQLMTELRFDARAGLPYLNPVYLMCISGARGGVEQIRQLAGMHGLKAKANGQIMEIPIKANWRDGLPTTEYFCTTSAARSGLVHAARNRRAPSYLMRKLVDAAGNVVVARHDCGKRDGITAGVVEKGNRNERSLSDSIRGRVSCQCIVDVLTARKIIDQNEMISSQQARVIEDLGIDKLRVRSPLTCAAPRGVCRLCYGMDLATGALVEEGKAVGVVAAQAIGGAAAQFNVEERTFLLGDARNSPKTHIKANKAGAVKFLRIMAVTNAQGEGVALSRNGQIAVIGADERILQEDRVPNGAILEVADGQSVRPGQSLFHWDPWRILIIAGSGGQVRFEEVVEGETLCQQRDLSGFENWIIGEHRGDLHPQVVVVDEFGQAQETHFLPENAHLAVREGQQVTTGALLAHVPYVSGIRDFVGGKPVLMDVLEARGPRYPGLLAEVGGRARVEWNQRGPATIFIEEIDEHGHPTGRERPHRSPYHWRPSVVTGDDVNAGDPLTMGLPVPHDLLRIGGVERVQAHLLNEIRLIFRCQRVDVDDRHIEIVIAQMLRKVEVKHGGDTEFLPGMLLDRVAFAEVNDRLRDCVKVADPGASHFEAGAIVSKKAFDEDCAGLAAAGKQLPTFATPIPASGIVRLQGITQAATNPEGFLAAAAFHEPTRVLTMAALAGKVDYLAGVKENVILGRLIPAGDGFTALCSRRPR